MKLRTDTATFAEKMNWLPGTLIIIGILSMIFCFSDCAKGHNDVISGYLGIVGIVNCVGMCALSVILKAALKYLSK